jgi:D-psicose/D-tagatose/L-ribulose 3-epimerase
MITRFLAFLPFALGACAHQSPSAPTAAAALSARPPASATWTTGIKIGRATGIAGLEESKTAGFDYVELGVATIARLSDEEFEKAAAEHAKIGLSTPVANGFIPKEIKVVGPAVDHAQQMAYFATALDRMARLGVKIIVFGSGPARQVPDGFPRDKAFDQLVDVAKRLAPEAQKRDITVAVEPLRQQESNIMNTAAEGLKWVEVVNHPHFQLMVDFYHLSVEKEDADILVTAKDHIVHFHFANPTGRVYPKLPDEYDYAKFFTNMRKMGYSGGISVEAGTKDFATEGPMAVAFLRAQIKRHEIVASP